MDNKPFGGFSAGLAKQKPVSGCGGILVLGKFAAIFAGLELGGLLYLQHFAAKRSG